MNFKPLVAVAIFAAPMLSAHAASLDDLAGSLFSGESSLLLILAGVGVMATIARRRYR
jgi:hypothetical protein